MIGIDTNVLVRYVVRDDEEQFAAASAVLEALTSDRPGFITQTVLAEFYWVLTRSYHFSPEVCRGVISALVSTETLEFDDGEGVVRALWLAAGGADFGDALIQGSMELYGVATTVTFDRRAAARLGWQLLR